MNKPLLASFLLLIVIRLIKASDDNPPEVEPLPQPLPLASPERSSVDQRQFDMAAKYLKHQFSIPHHLVPSFEDTAGVLAHEAADDTVNDDDDPLEPGAPVSSLRSNHAERDRQQQSHQGHASDRRKLTSDNFYDYYDYVDSSGDYEEYEDYQDNRRQPSVRNHYHVTKPRGGFFPEISLGLPRPISDKRPPLLKARLSPPHYRRGGPGYVKERTSFSEGSWVRPPGQQAANRRPQAPKFTRKKTTVRPALFQPTTTPRPRQPPQRRRRPIGGSPSSSFHDPREGSFLGSLVQQVRGTLSNMLYGGRAVAAFPRIQYGPVDFGPPLGLTNKNSKRKQLEDFVYDHSFRGGRPTIPSSTMGENNYANDFYDEDYYDKYEEYEVEDNYFDQYPYNEKTRQKSRIQTKKNTDERNLIVNKSPSSGQITVVVLPSDPDEKIRSHSNSEAIINELRGIKSNKRRRKNNQNKRIDEYDDEYEDKLENHKFGKDYEIEIVEDDEKQLSDKEKRLKDLIDFVNGGEVPKSYEKKKIINLGVKNSLSDDEDMNELFDDVIETTPSSLSLGGNIEWGKKMWKEVEDEFKDDTHDRDINDKRRRQKIRVRKQKEPPKNSITSTDRPLRKVVDDANILSIWAAAEKVRENGPSLRFASSEESRESEEIIRREDTDKIYKYKPSPTPATKQFYRENFDGFNLKPDNIERDFYGGFEPSSLDVSSRRGHGNGNDMTFSGSRRQNVLHSHPNIDNHSSSSARVSYDKKMILDLPPVTPSSLPPGVSRDVTRDRLRDGGPVMTQHHPFYHHQMTPARTKTLQELTFGS